MRRSPPGECDCTMRARRIALVVYPPSNGDVQSTGGTIIGRCTGHHVDACACAAVNHACASSVKTIRTGVLCFPSGTLFSVTIVHVSSNSSISLVPSRSLSVLDQLSFSAEYLFTT